MSHNKSKGTNFAESMKGFNEYPGLRIKVEKIVLGIRFFKVNKKSRNARKKRPVRSQGITNKTRRITR